MRRFAERAADVPVQLRRRLAIIRSLDEQISNTQKEVEEKIRRSILDKGRGGGGAKRQKVQHAEQRSPQGSLDIHGAVQRISNLAEEKVYAGCWLYSGPFNCVGCPCTRSHIVFDFAASFSGRPALRGWAGVLHA